MSQIVIIAHDIRSAHNVGSILRTADGLGVEKVFLTGYSPYPVETDDQRLPHISRKVAAAIHKTALGAEHSQGWEHEPSIDTVVQLLRGSGYHIYALEQGQGSTELPGWRPENKVAIVLGREVEGVSQSVIDLCDDCLEIPMSGSKESFNVAQAAAIALYHARFGGNNLAASK
jgi:tRNA G18 (ribose-2'-O)-methylase SpoU